MIWTEQAALWHFKRSLQSLPKRMEERQSKGLETRIQRDELEAIPFAIAALEYLIAVQEYEATQSQK